MADGAGGAYIINQFRPTPGDTVERMRISSTGNVGINTASPVFSLDANGAIASHVGASEAQVHVYNATSDVYLYNSYGGNSIGLYDGTAGQALMTYSRGSSAWLFFTSGAERVRITSTGNVGIGTSTPGVALDVVGVVRSSASLVIGQGGTTGTGAIYSDSNWGCIQWAARSAPNIAEWRWANATDGELMRLDTSANLCIGVTSTTGSISNTKKLSVGAASTATGTLTGGGTASWQDAFTVTNPGLYILHAYIPGYNAGPGDWSNSWMVSYTGGANAYVGTSTLGATGNIQARPNPGAATTVQIYTGAGPGIGYVWTVLRVS